MTLSEYVKARSEAYRQKGLPFEWKMLDSVSAGLWRLEPYKAQEAVVEIRGHLFRSRAVGGVQGLPVGLQDAVAEAESQAADELVGA